MRNICVVICVIVAFAVNSCKTSNSPASPTEPGGGASRELGLSYYNAQSHILDFPVALSLGPAYIAIVGERFTLPGDSAFVDSVAVRIDSVRNNDTLANDSVEVDLMRDTLYTVADGRQFHIINVFTPSLVYDSAEVRCDSTHWGKFLTIPYRHTKVGKNFFVAVSPASHVQGGTIYFDDIIYAACDSEPMRTRTTDNCRSVFIGIGGGQIISGVLDSTVYFTSDPNYLVTTNFYAVAYVDTADAAVTSGPGTPHRDAALTCIPLLRPRWSPTGVCGALAPGYAASKTGIVPGR